MARPVINDVLQNMRFHVTAVRNGGGADGRLGIDAGFNAVSTPEMTLDAVEYREGHYVWTRKFPGIPSMGTSTMSRGVTRKDTSFYDWIKETVEGSGNYRMDLTIAHYHREANPGGTEFPIPGVVNTQIKTDEIPAKKYTLYNCFPTRHKVAADLDATSADVSIQEIEVVYEYFRNEAGDINFTEPG